MSGTRLGETRPHDRPRERLRSLGPGALTAVELLAILLGTGTSDRDAVAVAGDLLSAAGGTVRALARQPVGALARVRGVGGAKAARVAAALELARRAAAEEDGGDGVMRTPADVHRRCAPALRDLTVEEFRLLVLDTQHRVVRDLLITRGLLDSSLVHPREVFRAAIAEAAAGIVVLHNHPSGNPAPSADDRAVTRQLVEAGRLLDIPVYDHVIVGGDRYFSFAEAGLV
ncbi:MAG: DNA repair protein RadC [Gemmatimonadota bacterium]|nr:DNA repair protein RadC [Gemmatimonadota bacterium]MDH5199118.1 DNA repair protein RadC [Gemmatimonadota bacterium]